MFLIFKVSTSSVFLRSVFKKQARKILCLQDCVFLQKVFFQKPYGIILGPPKHVLHSVWSVLGISTAIKTALKVAPTGSSKWSINGKVKHYN